MAAQRRIDLVLDSVKRLLRIGAIANLLNLLQKQHPADLLWIRDEFLDSTADFGKVVVHGHSPALEPELLPNRINVDTGAFMTGRLTCAVLEDAQVRFLTATR